MIPCSAPVPPRRRAIAAVPARISSCAVWRFVCLLSLSPALAIAGEALPDELDPLRRGERQTRDERHRSAGHSEHSSLADTADMPISAPLAPLTVVATALPNALDDPTHIHRNPRQAQQRTGAGDAADYLRTIPGFGAVGNGATNGDAVLRGLGGSRLSLLANGTSLLGACGGRMDPPTAYLSPESYDAVEIVKGPQTVRWGPIASAGMVRFVRETPRFDKPGRRFHGNFTGGSFGRHDQQIDFAGGGPAGDARVIAQRTAQDNVTDGAGRTVPSAWRKWQVDTQFNGYLSPVTRVTLEMGAGDGQVRYPSRMMDGARFRRESVRIAVRHGIENSDDSDIDGGGGGVGVGTLFRQWNAEAYVNTVDHVMDNYSLRAPPDRRYPGSGTGARNAAMNFRPAASNVSRTLIGGRAELTLAPLTDWRWQIGMDALTEHHYGRSNPASPSDYRTVPWKANATQSRLGWFSEVRWQVSMSQRAIAGARIDRLEAVDRRPSTAAANIAPQRSAWLPGGFMRWEQRLSSLPATVFAGIGHTRRFPDHWERLSAPAGPLGSVNAFRGIQPERTTQLDVGVVYGSPPALAGSHTTSPGQRGDAYASARARADDSRGLQDGLSDAPTFWLNGYLGQVDDFILFDYPAKGQSRVRNVDARIYGAEAGIGVPVGMYWHVETSVATALGDNRTDGRPLAQMPPLDGKIALHYARGPWSAGALWQLVAAQHRWADAQGNVAGRDFGPSAGYGVAALNVGYAVNKRATLRAGVDNLFDKDYAPHLNRAGAAEFGYPAQHRFSAPGRTAWLRLTVDL